MQHISGLDDAKNLARYHRHQEEAPSLIVSHSSTGTKDSTSNSRVSHGQVAAGGESTASSTGPHPSLNVIIADVPTTVSTQRLDTSSFSATHQLIGREKESQQLDELFAKVIAPPSDEHQDATSCCCLVHGLSGVGKSALIEAALYRWKQPRTTDADTESSGFPTVFVAQGKFDQFVGIGSPYSAILNALDGLGQELWALSSPILKEQMRRALAYEGGILARMVPSLAQFLAHNNDDKGKQTNKPPHISPDVTTVPVVVVDASSSAQQDPALDEQRTQEFTLAAERLAVACLSFLQYFCRSVGPLVLFMDDLQWSDPHSHQLLASIANQKLPHFMMIGGYRDAEIETDSFTAVSEDEGLRGTSDEGESFDGVDEGDKDSVSIPNVRMKPFLEALTCPYVSLPVSNLDLVSVAELLRALLHLPTPASSPKDSDGDATHFKQRREQDLQDLAAIVFKKTFGNPYFVLQQLEYLHSRKLLLYNESALQWNWDATAVNLGSDRSRNVVDVIQGRISNVPLRVQHVLQLASCLGYYVDLEVLERLERIVDFGSGSGVTINHDDPRDQSVSVSSSTVPKNVNENHLQDAEAALASELFRGAVSRAEDEGLIECTGRILKFSHDRIQQSVYDTLVERTYQDTVLKLSSSTVSRKSVADLLHYRIGHHLRGQWTESGEERLLFLAVEQLERISMDFMFSELDDGDILELVDINLKASEVAKKRGALENVSSCLNRAVSLAKPGYWRFHYEMMLELYNSSAEVEFSLGRIEASNERVSVLMSRAVRETDKVRAMVVTFQVYGQQRQFKKAIAEGRKILKLLDAPMPSTNLLNIMKEFVLAKREAKRKSDQFFLEMPRARRAGMATAFKVLQISSVYGWNGDPLYAGLAFLRAMRLTMQEGGSDATPFIYSGFGYLLAEFGDEKEAFRFSQLCLKKSSGKETYPSSVTLTYASITHLQLPISIGLEPLLAAYRIGLETGDLFFGTICISVYVLFYFSCGLPLAPFAADMRNYMSQLKLCHQDVPLSFILPTCQLALNLMGQSQDSMDLSRESIRQTQRDFFNENLLLDESDASVLYMLYLQTFLLFILQADDAQLEGPLQKIYARKETRLGGAHVMNYFFTACDGLVGLRLSRQYRRKPGIPRSSLRFARKLAHNSIKTLKAWSKSRPINSVSLLALLEADQSARQLNRKLDARENRMASKRRYDAAIAQFARSGLVHYGAVANELAGLYMVEMKDEFWAEHYLGEAVKLYGEWNASVKVEQLCTTFDFLELPSGTSTARFAIQGKSRFNSTKDTFRFNS